MSIRTELAGTIGTLAPFPIGAKESSDFSAANDPRLGMEIQGPNGRVFRLVKYVGSAALTGPAAAGTNKAGGRGFAPTAANLDDPTTMNCVDLAVLGGTKPTNRPVGYALKDQDDLVQNDYFWLQVDGDYFDLWTGDDNTDIAPGDYLQIDNDTDLGTVKGTGTTFDPEFSQFVALDTVTAVDSIVRGRPIHKIRG